MHFIYDFMLDIHTACTLMNEIICFICPVQSRVICEFHETALCLCSIVAQIEPIPSLHVQHISCLRACCDNKYVINIVHYVNESPALRTEHVAANVTVYLTS